MFSKKHMLYKQFLLKFLLSKLIAFDRILKILSDVSTIKNVFIRQFYLLKMASQIQMKNSSMISTHISKNRSGSVFLSPRHASPQLPYAKLPLNKDTPKWNQSASTWRHSSYRYSFSRGERFKEKKPYYSDILQPDLGSTNQHKSCTFGKGNRKPISEVILRNAKQKPSPDAYDLNDFDEQTRSPKYGKSFGISWRNYEKVYIQHRKDVYSGHFNDENPPAHYEVRQIAGKDQRSFTTYGRLKMYTKKMSDLRRGNPGPQYKVKDRHLQNTTGLNQRSFGFGQRIDLSAPANNYPSAVYKIKGFCDKFTKTRKKNFPKKA